MGVRVKQNAICSETGCDVGETKMNIHGFTGGEWVRELIFMEVDQCGRAESPAQGDEIRKTHQIGGNDPIVLGQVFNFVKKMQGGSSHAPLPESRRKRKQIDSVPGIFNQAFGKIPVGASEKGFQKKKSVLVLFHCGPR